MIDNSTTLSVIDGESLLALDVDPPKFVVAKLIPAGLHLLAGSPKIGKSWLTLWLCHQVSVGAKVWEFDTQKCGALYISLEDTQNRLNLRLSRIAEHGSKDTKFATSAGNLTGNLIIQLESHMKAYPDTGLIVIDTFQRIRDIESESTYANDYREIIKIKALADKFNIAILLVHHLRKAPDSDPINMVSGSTGLSGAVDSIYVLEKEKRVENTATLYVTGRDIEDMQILLEFEREPPVWKFLGYGDKKEQKEEPIITALHAFLAERADFTGTASELFAALRESEIIADSSGITANNIKRKITDNLLTLEKSHSILVSFERTKAARLISMVRVTDDSASTGVPSSPELSPDEKDDSGAAEGVSEKHLSPVTDEQEFEENQESE